jgi:hypothetical protein
VPQWGPESHARNGDMENKLMKPVTHPNPKIQTPKQI